ncbi:glycosyltransferase family 4 protein [Hahella sp. CR1]|uniref:glycosyltransferase family 4 protein n=1 Tax=Hahella sp. CR1 TaxID=2992807 RepID=UPI002441F9BF|nr:glycosyltransferase family 4 protein [Hahella sp. CR1]MDG9667859.1 glycosyltransferase family 4 protein [Hahella sp. CR1]
MMDSKKKCNVLMVDQGLSFGGALVVLLSLAKSLPENYHPVVVTAIKENPEKWIDAGDIKVISCSPTFNYLDYFRVSHKISSIRNKVTRKILIYALSLYSTCKNLSYVTKLMRVIRENDIDIVHANNSVYVLMAAALTRKPCVWHIHGVVESPLSFLERLFSPSVKLFLAISGFVSNSAVKNRYPADRLKVIENPVDPAALDWAQNKAQLQSVKSQFNLFDDNFVVSIFGRIIPWKGQLELIEAIAKVAEKWPEVRLLIVGDASEGFSKAYNEKIKHRVEVLGIEENIIWAGFQKDVRPFYAISDLVVHASIDPEPFGLVIIEAMASGCPVIVSNLGAAPELVEDGVDGYVINPKVTDELSKGIMTLIESPELRKSFAEKGRYKVNQRFHPQSYALRMAEEYSSIVGKGGEAE